MKELFNVKESELKLVGYMLYKIRKNINFYLFLSVEDYDTALIFKTKEDYKIAQVYENEIYRLEDGRYYQII